MPRPIRAGQRGRSAFGCRGVRSSRSSRRFCSSVPAAALSWRPPRGFRASPTVLIGKNVRRTVLRVRGGSQMALDHPPFATDEIVARLRVRSSDARSIPLPAAARRSEASAMDDEKRDGATAASGWQANRNFIPGVRTGSCFTPTGAEHGGAYCCCADSPAAADAGSLAALCPDSLAVAGRVALLRVTLLRIAALLRVTLLRIALRLLRIAQLRVTLLRVTLLRIALRCLREQSAGARAPLQSRYCSRTARTSWIVRELRLEIGDSMIILRMIGALHLAENPDRRLRGWRIFEARPPHGL